MTKKEQSDALLSLNAIHGYIKYYGQDYDYDVDHILTHLKIVENIVMKDKQAKLISEIMQADEKDGLYNDVKKDSV